MDVEIDVETIGVLRVQKFVKCKNADLLSEIYIKVNGNEILCG